MKKIILTALLVFGSVAVASATESIVGGTSTTIGNATFNASAKCTLQVTSTVTSFAIAGKHLNSGTSFAIQSTDPIMKKYITTEDGVLTTDSYLRGANLISTAVTVADQTINALYTLTGK